MKRPLLFGLFVAALATACVALWLQSGKGGVVKLTDEQMQAALESGEGARDIGADREGGVDFPTIKELEHVADRAKIAAWARAAQAALDGADVEQRGDLLVLSAELERLLGNLNTARQRAKAGVEALPANSLARLVYANCILAEIQQNAAGANIAVAMVKSIKPANELKAELEVALELDANNHGARVRLAGMRAFTIFPLKSMKKARELVEGIGVYDPYLEKFWDAQLLIANEKHDEALAAYRALLEERPGDADVIAMIGALLLRNEQWEEAAAAYDSLTEMTDHPRGYDALFQAAKARVSGGFELEEALAMLRKIDADRPIGDLIPSLDRVKFHQGVVLAKLGRTSEARAALEQAQAIQPGTKRIEQALAELR